MTELIDTEGSSDVLSPAMPSSLRQSAAHVAAIERDYAEHRGPVLAMLRADFPRLADPEELYQEAWAELLALEARGEAVVHRRALLKKIAWRRAADAVKRRRPDAMDPSSPVMADAADDAPLPDEQAVTRLDAEALRLVVESLDEQQATVLKLRFDQHLTVREVKDRLGISEKRLEAIVTAAYKKIAAQLSVDEAGESRWARRQRSLLLACELGIASARQRRRAQEMVDRDPTCRAMLHAMRTSLGDVAAVLPMPLLVGEHERVGRLARATGRLDELLATSRHLAERITGRGTDANLVEQAGMGGASVGAGAVTAKVVAACLALGGTGALCVDVAHQLGEQPAKAKRPPARKATAERIVEPPRQHIAIVRRPKATQKPKPKQEKQTVERRETPVSSPKSTPPASPAPQGSTEFGPGAIGSSSAPKQPAAAPQNGGGEFTP